MKRLEKEYLLEGFIDTHIHTAPDTKPRALNDVEAALEAKGEKMRGIVIKSHTEPTAGRAKIAEYVSGIKVIGGVCLNKNVGGLNPDAVKSSAELGGRMVWFPTMSSPNINVNTEDTEDILHIIAEKSLVLATGHLSIDKTFLLIDMAKSFGIWKIIVNHPLTSVIGAGVDDQKELSKYAYIEHCYVACMMEHDNLNPASIGEAIEEVGHRRCIMATDFGQIHNPHPVEGMKMFVNTMQNYGISKKQIFAMCIENPSKLLF